MWLPSCASPVVLRPVHGLWHFMKEGQVGLSSIACLQVVAVHLCAEPWTIENGLLTPTMKLKRPTAQKHFQAQLDALYKLVK